MAKVLGTIYMSVLFFFCIWYMIFQFNQWIDKMKASKRKPVEKKPEETVMSFSPIDVVGKSTTVFLAPLVSSSEEPMMSENLELEEKPEVISEPVILPEEIQANLNHPVVLDEDEVDDYSGDIADWDRTLSKGLTYQQISDAIDVVEGRKSGKNNEYFAGETFSMMPDDFVNTICMQADHEAMVKKLIAGYLDFPSKMKPVPVSVANFDIKNYV